MQQNYYKYSNLLHWWCRWHNCRRNDCLVDNTFRCYVGRWDHPVWGSWINRVVVAVVIDIWYCHTVLVTFWYLEVSLVNRCRWRLRLWLWLWLSYVVVGAAHLTLLNEGASLICIPFFCTCTEQLFN